MLQRTDVLIVGGGQAGLALSRCLMQRRIDHEVIERGDVAQRWIERRASLRLLTPAWMTRLPGHRVDRDARDTFLCRDDVVDMLQRYARGGDCPVRTGVAVERLAGAADGFTVVTSGGTLRARAVVLATGACDRPAVPQFAASIDPRIFQLAADRFVDARDLPEGGVLVVGGSATGLQLAEEIARAGRAVTLSVGRHVRVPRRYRGHDIFHWLDACGLLTERRRAGDTRADRLPSFQLVGDTAPRDLDLGTVSAAGVLVTGRTVAAEGTRIHFEGSLGSEVAAADERLRRLLDRIDAHIARAGIAASVQPRPMPLALPEAPAAMDLAREGIRSVVWATGYRRDFRWLDLPVVRPDGDLDQAGGLTRIPGLYALGLPFMRRRNSTFIDGVGADAAEIADAISTHLGVTLACAA